MKFQKGLALLMLLLAVLAGPWSLRGWVGEAVMLKTMDFSWAAFFILGVNAVVLFFSKKKIRELQNDSFLFNAWLVLILVVIFLLSNRIWSTQLKVFRIIFLLLILIAATRTFYRFVIHSKREKWKQNTALILFSLFFIFSVLESVSMFYTASNGIYPESFGHINWLRKYWGSRWEGPDWSRRDTTKRSVLVIGDSFGAGAGVMENERFSDIIEQKDPGLQVFNQSIPGIDTRREEDLIWDVPFVPDVIVLSYCLNDIQPAAENTGKIYQWNDLYGGSRAWIRPFVHYSHFLNYLFTQYAPRIRQADYIDFLEECFNDQKIREEHFSSIHKIKMFSILKRTQMIAVVWPFLIDAERTREMTEMVWHKMIVFGISSVNLSDMILETGESERIVSPLDAHPSPLLHQKVADTLIRVIRNMEQN